jgi:hypothetical protein
VTYSGPGKYSSARQHLKRFNNAASMAADNDLDALRDRQDLKSLLAGLAAKP